MKKTFMIQATAQQLPWLYETVLLIRRREETMAHAMQPDSPLPAAVS